MSEALENLNSASPEIAERLFLDCCGSRAWARQLVDSRPFLNAAELFEKADRIWKNLDREDWLEAFAAHPRIGERSGAKQSAQFAHWSHGEQSGVSDARDETREKLAEANRLYEAKFGYIFIVCATGKSAEEMLEICRERLENESDAEVFIAAEEQRKITEIRLKKLLEIK